LTKARDYEHCTLPKRTGTPRPSDSDIEGVALRQLLDVIEFLVRMITRE